MNSYNENLRSSVVKSLSQQEVDLKKIAASRDASMFSLYYAEGARITSAEKLKVSSDDYQNKQQIHEKAVQNNNISINLVDSATQGNTYTSLSTSNIAIGAANVQVAANAILKLASDVGSIFTIAKAADFDTQIHAQAKEVNLRMNDTAYDAEVASQLAMEASSLTAQVSSSTVFSEAKVMGASMTSLSDDLSAQFDTSAALMASDNDTLELNSSAEKKKEGTLEDINVEYYAANSAYDLTNKELNINLRVMDNSSRGVRKTNSFFTAQFSEVKSPFRKKGEAQGYPVTDYYVLITKNERKSTFSITTAEGIVWENKSDQFVHITPDAANVRGVFQEKIYISQLLDTDGDPIELGAGYTLFVYAKLAENYKKALNNFDNYLSAPSPEFQMQNELIAPAGNKVKSTKVSGGRLNERNVKFELTQNHEYNVSYRLFLLPDNREFVQGLLTADGLRSVEQEVERLEKIADEYDPKIDSLEKKINTLQANDTSLNEQKDEAQTNADNANVGEAEKFLKEVATLQTKIVKNTKDLTRSKKELRKLLLLKRAAENKIHPNAQSKPGFFFNLLLAEQVPAGSYINVKKEDLTITTGSDDMDQIVGVVSIPEDATDNFGNRLLDGVKYIPTILSFSEENSDDDEQFLNALSDFTTTSPFIYKS